MTQTPIMLETEIIPLEPDAASTVAGKSLRPLSISPKFIARVKAKAAEFKAGGGEIYV